MSNSTISILEFSTSYIWEATNFDRVLHTEEGYYLFASVAERKHVYRALKKGLSLKEALNPSQTPPPIKEEPIEEVIPHHEELSKKQLKDFKRKFEIKFTTEEKELPIEEKEDNSLIDKETGLLESFPKEFRQVAKKHLIKIQNNRLFQQWLNKELPWQQMLLLLKAQKNIDLLWITPQEWETKKINEEHKKQFGFRSPKLSKALIQLGLTQQEVSTLLSTTVKDVATSKVLGTKEAAEEQGNSIHYSSCQATDSRAVWGGDLSYNSIDEDLEVVGKSLFFWVVGESMKVNGEGYKARAKVRILYKERECINVAGLYVDRPYGQHKLLVDNFHQLEEWWEDYCICKGIQVTPIFIPPVWKRDNGAGNDFQNKYGKGDKNYLYCPSACYGYQDTMTHGIGGYNFFLTKSQKESLVLQAYKARTKIGGVYMSNISEVKYNPQRGISAPVITLPTWKSWDDLDYRFFSDFYQATGKWVQNPRAEKQFYKQRHWYFEVNGINYLASWKEEEDQSVSFHSLEDLDNHKVLWIYNGNEFNMIYRESIFKENTGHYVNTDIPEFGYLESINLCHETYYSEEHGCNVTSVNRNYVEKKQRKAGFDYARNITWLDFNKEGIVIKEVSEEQLNLGFCPAWPIAKCNLEKGYTVEPIKYSMRYIDIKNDFDIEALKERTLNLNEDYFQKGRKLHFKDLEYGLNSWHHINVYEKSF